MPKLLGTGEINIAVVRNGKPGPVLDWVQDWDSHSVLIDNVKIISPKMFTGLKDSSGRITGIAMGRSISLTDPYAIGIIGYSQSLKTFEISAKDGSAIFGLKGKTSINLSPNGTLDVSANITVGGISGQNGYLEVLNSKNIPMLTAGSGGVYASSIHMRKNIGDSLLSLSRYDIMPLGAEGYEPDTATIDIEGDKFLLTQTKNNGGVLVYDDTEINPGTIKMSTRDQYTSAGIYNNNMYLSSYGLRIGQDNPDLNNITIAYDRGVFFQKGGNTSALNLTTSNTIQLTLGSASVFNASRTKASFDVEVATKTNLSALGDIWLNNSTIHQVRYLNSPSTMDIRTNGGLGLAGGPLYLNGNGIQYSLFNLDEPLVIANNRSTIDYKSIIDDVEIISKNGEIGLIPKTTPSARGSSNNYIDLTSIISALVAYVKELESRINILESK